MTHIIDTRTILLLIGVNVCVLTLCMIYYFFSRKIYKGFGAWTTGISFICLGFFLLGFRNLLPDAVTIILANALIYSALMLFYMGFTSFAQKKMNLRLHIPSFILTSFILFPFLTYIKPSVNTRICLISFAAAFYFFICTRTLIKDIRHDPIRQNKLLAATLISNTFFFLFRGIFFMLPQNHIDTFLASGGFNSMALLMINVLVLLYVIGLIQLNSQMLEVELYQDNTDLKESEERYRLLVEQSSQGVVILQNNPLRLNFVNKPMEVLTGYTQKEMLNFSPRELMNLIYPEDRTMILDNLKNRISGKKAPEVYDIRIHDKSKRLRWAEVYSSRIEYNRKPAVQAFVVDVNERKKALKRAESLNQLNEDLIGSDSLNDKIKLITDAVVNIFKADFARIWTVKPGDLCDSGCIHSEINTDTIQCRHPEYCLHLCASSGRYTHINGDHGRVPFGHYKIGTIAAGEEKNFLTNNITSDPQVYDHEWAKKLGLVSFAGYRLLSDGGAIIGVLAMFSKTRINPEVNAMLEHLAGTAARVIQAAGTEESLRESEERFRAIFEQAAVGVSLNASDSGQYIRINRKFCDIVGYTREEMLSMTFQDITHPDDLSSDMRNMEQLREGIIRSFSMEKRYLHKNGSIVWVELTVSPMWAAGDPPDFHIAIVKDITEHRHAENLVKASLKEKETLLREIHHRVKNNMQVVSSLLNLQAEKIIDKKALSYFTDAQTRVQSIALVHEILYQSETLSLINLQWYLDRLLNHLFIVFLLDNREVDVDIKAHQVLLKIDQAIPCGLVVTELLTNTMKFAVPDNDHLKIRINVCYEADEQITMIIADNGSGMPPHIDNTQTLGLKLVTGLIEDQLEGSWQLGPGPGTCWIIKWPV